MEDLMSTLMGRFLSLLMTSGIRNGNVGVNSLMSITINSNIKVIDIGCQQYFKETY